MRRPAGTDVHAGSSGAPDALDYAAPAELFMARTGFSRRGPLYRRFASAAAAIQFAVEQSAAPLPGPVLEVAEQRFDHREIRKLYDAAAYPLLRRKPAGSASQTSLAGLKNRRYGHGAL